MNVAASKPIARSARPPLDRWVPRQSLSIGVTGHRLERLGDHDLAAVTAAAERLLANIAEMSGLPSVGALRLVSPLADGADSLVADAAIAQGWSMDAVLPFARETYAADFAVGEARDGHARTLAAADSVFELPGDRDANGGSAVAYERAGRVVLAQSDLLLAIWDSGPGRGRGGAAQIVAEAVLQGIPVIQIDPAAPEAPLLLWRHLSEHDADQHSIDTVPRGDLLHLPALLRQLIDPPDNRAERAMLARFEAAEPKRARVPAIAYPLLLALTGVRRLRRTDFAAPLADAIALPCGAESVSGTDFGRRLETLVTPRFGRADRTASMTAQLFRSSYVTNFSFAALAVVLSLLGLALPSGMKPVLIAGEVLTIGAILILTRTGNRAGWHRRWLDNRHLAERLRCLAISAQLGDLDLRADADKRPSWVSWYARATARELGLADARVETTYLRCVRTSLLALIDDQIAYLSVEAQRMHRLEHRLHLLGTVLFATTALICLGVLFLKVADQMSRSAELTHFAHPMTIAATIASAALPAIGAAIYGIRMQGDFAGTAARAEALAHHLDVLRHATEADEIGFDTLRRRVRRATELLTEDLANWLQTYHARPLSLPG